MNQIQTMRVFVCVAEQQSRRAAHHLGVSNALVTRSIAMLEGHLNTRLIHRTTRNLSLTEAGVRYLDGCRALLEEFDHLESSVAHAVREPAGTLRVVASGLLSPLALTPLVSSFRRRYPELRVQLTVAEGPLDVLDSGYDVGIVTGNRFDGNPTLVGHALSPNPFVAVAAPAYLERRGEPRLPDDLPGHDWVTLAPHQHAPAWQLVGHDGVAHSVTVRPTCTVNQLALVHAAAVAGAGIAVLPEPRRQRARQRRARAAHGRLPDRRSRHAVVARLSEPPVRAGPHAQLRRARARSLQRAAGPRTHRLRFPAAVAP